MREQLSAAVENAFKDRFGGRPEAVINAPGRVNLIGEHTDYSEGFVMPMAINRGISIAASPRQDSRLRVFSIDFDEMLDVRLDDLQKSSPGWQEYIKGVAWVMQRGGQSLCGWDGVMAGDVPIGAGLSSSAAVEIASAFAFNLFTDIQKSRVELASAAQKAERVWVGVQVGIMDQLISAVGKKGHAVRIDCRTLEYKYVQIPREARFVVLDTGTRRELSNSAYNERREECEQAAQVLGVNTLRDATLIMLTVLQNEMNAIVYKRARHVISENKRVHDFAAAMRDTDFARMGALLNQSHASLRDDFEVSSTELDLIVEIALRQPGCFGARMTGAGFGGCALALIKKNAEKNFIESVRQEYSQITQIDPSIFSVAAEDGVSSEKVET